ncbi:MAG: hypothetical protein EOP04_07160 [Proteobacteria bacterium]|nr:MAG: hypothetical protein EOP04_07160 [Pseudomonadota bacterium]
MAPYKEIEVLTEPGGASWAYRIQDGLSDETPFFEVTGAGRTHRFQYVFRSLDQATNCAHYLAHPITGGYDHVLVIGLAEWQGRISDFEDYL